MAETLLTPSSIKLFGRVMSSLTFTNDTTAFAGDYFLQRQFAVNSTVPFQGTTTAWASPPPPPPGEDHSVIISNIDPLIISQLSAGMLVQDPNPPASPTIVIQKNTVITAVNLQGDPDFPNSIFISRPAKLSEPKYNLVAKLSPLFARIYDFSFEGAIYSLPIPLLFLVHGPGIPISFASRSSLDQSGVVAREWEFSQARGNGGKGDSPPGDLRYWEYEKGDFSLRLDMEAGPFEQILLQAALRSGSDRADRSGAGVSGAGVSGAGVSGAGVSGAGVSGAGLRR